MENLGAQQQQQAESGRAIVPDSNNNVRQHIECRASSEHVIDTLGLLAIQARLDGDDGRLQ